MTAKQRKLWREQFADAVIIAAGAAVILGRQDIAQALNQTLFDIDRQPEKVIQSKQQPNRAKNRREKP